MSQCTLSRILVAPDSRSAERALIAELAQASTAKPLGRRLVIVPSLRLRTHLLGRLARERPAWLGLEITTLRGFARRILEGAGEPALSGAEMQEILVVRLAAREPALARPLGALTDGFAGVGAVVRDLLDAGLGPDHLEPALERVAEEEVNFGRSAIERAAALLRVAVDAREALLGLGLTPDADLFARATALVSSDPDAVLPGTQLFVHAIADATGVASDLLAAATRAFETVIVAEEPAGFEGERLAFGRRLSDRLAGIAAMERLAPNLAAPRIRLLRVPDPEGEAALAIARLGERAQASGRPEDLAVIARQLTPYTESLAREIDRRAVPASGESGPAGPAARVAATWIELLTLGGEADLGILLAAAGEALAAQAGARVWELRHGAAALDAHDLAGFAGLSTRSARAGSSADPRLPIRDRMTAQAEEGRLLAIERRLPGSKILAAATAGRRLLAGLQTLAGRGTLAVALSTLGRLLNEFVADPVVRRELFDALAPLQGAPPPTMASEFAGVEVVQLLRDAWSQLATAPFGAESKEAGDGGLSLLSVTDARGLTFDSLAIVGLAHDQFPRSIRSDPFLPDPLRQRLRDLLPDLPVKAEGHDEERFLFAQLLGAADVIDLYSPRRDGEGKELAESSFLAPLARAGRIAEILDLHPGRDLTPVAALEIAERLALAAGSQTLEASLCAAIVEARERFGGDTGGAPAVANARLAALREFDVAPGSDAGGRLGPFFGFIGTRLAPPVAPRVDRDGGSAGELRDPRSPTPAVTTLQALGTCGWQTFLERLLRLAPTPATGIELPAIPPTLFGLATHSALQWLAPPELASRTTLAEALAGGEIPVAWPPDPVLDEIVARAARQALADAGLEPELFAVAVELAVRERLKIARAQDWHGGVRPLIGIEINAEAEVATPAGMRRVRFRADRVEREGERIVFTDYKTGAALSTAKRPETRARHLVRALEAGDQLQLAAYALARAAAGGSVGRLLYLRPDLAHDRRELRLEEPQPGTPWSTLLAAWDAGAFLPRLLQDDLRTTGKACKYCVVRVACLQGDSGARQRLARWVELRREGASAQGDVAAAELFDLHHGSEREDGEETPE